MFLLAGCPVTTLRGGSGLFPAVNEPRVAPFPTGPAAHQAMESGEREGIWWINNINNGKIRYSSMDT